MKKTFLKKTLLAVPAAALMLGSAEAQTTVGFNIQAWYYDSGTTPQTVGYGSGYQTTGFPTTATAFGVPVSGWFNTDPISAQATVSEADSFGPGNALTANLSAPNAWQSGIGELNTGGWVPQAVSPGNDEVTWGYLDDGNATGSAPSATVTGLAAVFPHGYVAQTIAAESGKPTFQGVELSDGTTTVSNTYITYYVANTHDSDTSGGTVGLSAPNGVFTGDTLTITPGLKTSGTRSTLAGFIITDVPVVTLPPLGLTNNLGDPFSLSAGSVIGIPPLTYQWQINGSNIAGATAAVYTNASALGTDSGAYTLVVSNAYGATTSAVAQVSILLSPSIAQDLPAHLTNYSTMNAALAVSGGGVPPLAYTWFKNGSAISPTTSSLTLTNLQTTDAGSYQVVIQNSYGAVTSGVTVLTVLPSSPPYEGFAYSAGNLAGQGGGVGWSGSWSNETGYNGEATVLPSAQPWRGGLAELTSTGSALQLAGTGSADFDDIRNLLTTVGGPGSGTVYLSVAMQVTNDTWGGIELVQDGVTTLFLGECWEGSDWGWGTRAGPDVKSTIAPTSYSLLVYRFDYTPTNTLVSLYVNPSSLASEPTSPTIAGSESKQVTFDQLRIVTHGALGAGTGPDGELDEIRVGGSWAAVTPHTLRNDAPFALAPVPGGVIPDTKPSGTPHDGLARNVSWVPTSTDINNITRNGVEQFSSVNGGQITIPADPAFAPTTGTVAFWMQYSIPVSGFPGTGAEAAMLVDHRTTNGAIIGLSTGGGIEFQAYQGINSFTGSGYLVDGAWHHVAVTFDTSASGSVSIYVDGALDTSHANTNLWKWPLTQEVEIGKSHDPYWYVYDGQLDDFRIYNTVLSPTEIALIAQPTSSDELAEPNALLVRYNFDTASTGTSISWPFGTLQSSPTLGPDAVWTSLTNAVSPMPIISTDPSVFYRLFATP
jgi:hypothetical protein